MNYLIFVYILIISSLVSGQLIGQTQTNPKSQAKELGQIAWMRDYDTALKLSKAEGKPVFILFQEVPGCATCQNFGDVVLSHPFIVDAIQNEFIALAIFNNKKGDDLKVLQKYNEPTWNNPVSRIVDHSGKDIVTRLSGQYSMAAMTQYLRNGLSYAGREVPPYLQLYADEIVSEKLGTETVYYSMYCFWTGEAKLGQLEGVISTSPGFMNGKEVVEVNYDADKISRKKITNYATANKFAFVKDPSLFKIDKDPQYYLKQSIYKYLPLSKSQRSKINSALAQGKDADQYLSPLQLSYKIKIEAFNTRQIDQLDIIYDLDLNDSAEVLIMN
mgnify:CR=1 FL=1